MKPKFHLIAVALAMASLTFLNSPTASASGVVAGATEPTQIMNNIELVASNIKEAEQISNQLTQIANQIQAYKNMVTNTLNVPNQIWQNADGLLQQLVGVVNQGQALAFSATNINSLFQQKYPGYTPPQDFGAAYQNINETTLDSVRGALNAANLQSQDFTTEQGALNAIEAQSQSATGRMQAIQAGNSIAMAQVQQMRKMRALQMAQMQAQGAYVSGLTQQKADDAMMTKQMFDLPRPPTASTATMPKAGK
jgi:P-type conjugative transfer protein TrbJ